MTKLARDSKRFTRRVEIWTGVKRWLAVVGGAAVVTFVLIAMIPRPAGAGAGAGKRCCGSISTVLGVPCAEDEACWDCVTMGNFICGTVVVPSLGSVYVFTG